MTKETITPRLHGIESIVTPDKFEFGVHRMRVEGGWIYWLQPMGGAYVSQFVPDPARVMGIADWDVRLGVLDPVPPHKRYFEWIDPAHSKVDARTTSFDAEKSADDVEKPADDKENPAPNTDEAEVDTQPAA